MLPQGKPCALTWKLNRTLARLGVIAILVTSRCLPLEFEGKGKDVWSEGGAHRVAGEGCLKSPFNMLLR